MVQARHLAVLAGIFAVYFTFAGLSAATQHIWSNEAWFASPAFTLAHKGYLGTGILESKGTWMDGIERRTYWMPPVHLLVQAAWYRLFGFSLLSMRAISILAGAVVLLAWYWIVSMLARSRDMALLAVALVVMEPRFFEFAALGRPDMLCAAFGTLGLAAYLHMRSRSFAAAVGAGHGLAAAACLTHPCGVLYAGGVLLLMLSYDRARIGWRPLGLAALPYAAGLGAWGIYILQAPSQFRSQFLGNISGIAYEFAGVSRWRGLASPLGALKVEYFLRYGSQFGWYSAALADRVQLYSLLVYTVAVAGCLLTPSIRKHDGYRALLLIGAFDYVVLSYFEGLKGTAYLIHTLPLCATLLAIYVHFLYSAAGRTGNSVGGRRRAAAWALTVAMFAFAAVQLDTTIRYIVDQPVRQDYEQVVAFLRRSKAPSRIIAAGELAFALGFDSGMVDDIRLGYFSGQRPRFIVANTIYRGWMEQSAHIQPAIHKYMTELLRDEYRVAFHNTNYTVYERIKE